MKKLLFFLLVIPSLLSAQKVEYFPRYNDNWQQIRPVAFAVLLPDDYTPAKKYPFEITIHGIGERGGCRLEDLQNIVLGPDYNRDRIRESEFAFVNADKKRAVNDYDMILVVPTYGTREFFEPAMINYVYDFIQQNYSVVDKMLLSGFSYGGGATLKYITASTENAGKVAYAVPCAPTRHIVDPSIPGKAGLPVHIFVNDEDDNPNTDLSVTKGIITDLNKSSPAVPARYTAFDKSGHGGYNEAMTISPPVAPGGQGVTDLSKNVYQLYADLLGGVQEPPPPAKTIIARLFVAGLEVVVYSDRTAEVK